MLIYSGKLGIPDSVLPPGVLVNDVLGWKASVDGRLPCFCQNETVERAGKLLDELVVALDCDPNSPVPGGALAREATEADDDPNKFGVGKACSILFGVEEAVAKMDVGCTADDADAVGLHIRG